MAPASLPARLARTAAAAAIASFGVVTATTAGAVQDPSSCPSTVISLGNGGFESPVIAANSYALRPDSELGGWRTTESDHLIELWRTPFGGVTAAEGQQHAELNANTPSTLYQDVATTPGTTVYYRAFHRGRAGVDSAQMQFGPPAGPANFTRLMVDGTSAWGQYTGTYVIPAGQTVTRFAFAAISSAGGNPSVGNFLDGIQFGTAPCVTTTKTVTNLSGSSPAHAGDQLEYAVTVANGGGNDAGALIVNDPVPAGTTYVPGSLSVTTGANAGAKTDAAGDDQADYDAATGRVRFRVGTGASSSTGGTLGSGQATTVRFRVTVSPTDGPSTVTNTAVTGWVDPLDPTTPQTSTSNDVSITVTTPAVTVVKSSTGFTDEDADGAVSVGDAVHYAVSTSNVGSEPFTTVTVSDPRAGALVCDPTTSDGAAFSNGSTGLAPGDRVVCRGSITVTQSDVDGGGVENTATATAVGSSGVTVVDDDTLLVPTAAAAPSLQVAKSALPAAGASAGDTIAYTVTATNNGNVTLHAVTVSDDMVGPMACSPSQPGVLAPGQTMVCSGSRAVTQADVDRGSITNTASAAALDPSGGAVTGTSTLDTATVPRVGRLTMDKRLASYDDADGSGSVSAGDVVHYALTATNTGTVTASGVTVSDPSATGLACTPATPADLAPTASVTCTAAHTVTQADVDAGEVRNTATAEGSGPPGVSVPPASATLNVPTEAARPRLVLTKTPALTTDADDSGTFTPGDTITYTMRAVNTGNVTLTGVTVDDPLLPTLSCSPTIPATLAPTDAVTCTAAYVLTSADATAGSRTNTASATGTPPAGPAVTATGTSSISVATPTPAIMLTKTLSGHSDPDGSGSVTPGDVLTYTLTATNTGNVTLHGVDVEDPSTSVSCTPTTPASLTPGTSLTCTGTRTVTQSDQDAGAITNTAVARGLSPTDTPVTDTRELTVATSGRYADATLAKRVLSVDDTNGNGAPDVGERITYQLTLTNTGNVTLDDAQIRDDRISGLDCTPSAGHALAPGAAMVCTGTLVVGQTDQDRGVVVNRAVGSGSTPIGDLTRSTEADVLTAAAQPALRVTKRATVSDTDGSGRGGVGESVFYTLTATNTGNVSLDGVVITDPLAGTLTCTPTAPARLEPGGSLVCHGQFRIRQQDLDAGHLTNVAFASGEDQAGHRVTSVAALTLRTDRAAPDLRLVKTAGALVDRDRSGDLTAGDVVPFVVVATNSGNVTLHRVTISDPLLPGMTCDAPLPATLAPGTRVSCAGGHVVTAAEAAVGLVRNVATADTDDTYGPFRARVATAQLARSGGQSVLPAPLPSTGGDLGGPLLLGGALVVGGLLLGAGGRSRRPRAVPMRCT